MGERSARGEQLHLGPGGNKPLCAVEDLNDMGPIRCDQGYTDAGPAMPVKVVDLGRAELELSSQLGDQRPDQRALFLQRVHVAEP
jgi:hypothetical protein